MKLFRLNALTLPKTLSGLCLLLPLIGCSTTPPVHHDSLPPPPPPIPTAAERQFADKSKLAETPVQVVQVGETVKIIIPDEAIFAPNSSNVKSCFKPTLEIIADLIQAYDTDSVSIKAYTDNRLPCEQALALTNTQAQVVAHGLNKWGTHAPFVYAVGKGQLAPVDTNETAHGRNNNRRVEIDFKFYPHATRFD